MISKKPFLLACTALIGVAAFQPQLHAAPLDQPFVVAQAPAGTGKPDDKKKPAEKPAAQNQKPAPQQKPAAQAKPPQPPKPAAQAKPPQPPAAQAKPPQQPKPAAQTKPPQPPKPAAQTKPAPQPKPAAQTKPAAPAAQSKPAMPATPAMPAPAAQTKPAMPATPAMPAPAAQNKPAMPAAPAMPAPAAQNKPSTPAPAAKPAPAAQTKPAAPAVSGKETNKLPRVNREPPKVRDAKEFLHRDNKQPRPSIADVRKDRTETREGNRVYIREGDRTIIRQDNRTIIQHSESSRFAIGARDVRTERRGDQFVTIVDRPGGVRIISYADSDGRLLRRVRRGPQGREIVLIDNRFDGPRAGFFIDLAPPVVHIPRDRYIVEADRATPVIIYDTFMAPPVERIDQRYTLEQVRYSNPLRERMPRVDLDVNFDTGSWSLGPDDIARLAAVASGLNRAIAKNPREMFLIEGHTDAVGDPEDNLSLSDRRAEAVAVALTEGFKVPAENLVTQGYGEQFLKVPTQGPSRENRFVAVRRITPLIDKVAAR
jgi:outer membrane protein OmpA-like peptidoglycan-associated protein